MKEIISLKNDYNQGVDSHIAWLPKGDATGNTIEVGDPKKVNKKGAKKKKKRAAPGDDHPMTKNGRPRMFDERRKPQVCDGCKASGHNKRSLKCKQHPEYDYFTNFLFVYLLSSIYQYNLKLFLATWTMENNRIPRSFLAAGRSKPDMHSGWPYVPGSDFSASKNSCACKNLYSITSK